MTDPGWDIPGVAREPAPGVEAPAASSANVSSAHRGKSGRRTRAGSVSACSGLSAGAFGRLADAGAGAAAAPAGPSCPPGSTNLAGTGPAAAATAAADPAAGGAVAGGVVAGGARITGPAQALELLSAVTEYLAHANPAEWDEGQQADCLRALAVAESRQAAAHAKVLAAFAVPGGGVAGDGHRSPRVWLCWQTHATRKAAASKVSWMHRLAAHPPWPAPWAARRCRCRGRSRSWTGPNPCPTRSATRPIRNCSPPRPRARRCPTWPGLPRTSAASTPGPTMTATGTGSRTGGCGWPGRSAARAGSKPTCRPGAPPR